MDRPEVYIYPNPTQFRELPNRKPCFLSATIGRTPDVEIIGEETHISGGMMSYGEPGLEEGYLKIYPSKLHIIQHFGTNRKDVEDVTLLFKLTPSLHLSPSDFREYDFEGEAKLHRGDRFRFKLDREIELEFLNHYRWVNLENEEILTYPELIASAKLNRRPIEEDIDNYLSLIDDFLLLVSFAEGQRCISPLVSVHSRGTIAETYRLDRSMPNISAKHGFNDFLIDSNDFDDFINLAWKSLKEAGQYKLIKSALELITNDARGTMESEFLSLFSSIEKLILAFRLDYNYEFILKDLHHWNSFDKNLHSFIKKHELFKDNPEARSLIYQNIAGLKRLPLQEAFKKFTESKKLDLNDLWTFYDDSSEWSLTDIRNHLVHGYGLGDPYIDSFGNALKSLRYLAKRLMLVSLNWDFKESRLFRMSDREIDKWKNARAILKQWG